jgi:hypothetical protein
MNSMTTGLFNYAPQGAFNAQGGYGSVLQNRMGGLGGLSGLLGGMNPGQQSPQQAPQQAIQPTTQQGGYGGFNQMMGGYGNQMGGFNPMMGGFGGGGFNPMMSMGLGSFGGFNPMMGGFGGGFNQMMGGYNPMMGGFGNQMGGFGNPFGGQFQGGGSPFGMMLNPNYDPTKALQDNVPPPGDTSRQMFIPNPTPATQDSVPRYMLGEIDSIGGYGNQMGGYGNPFGGFNQMGGYGNPFGGFNQMGGYGNPFGGFNQMGGYGGLQQQMYRQAELQRRMQPDPNTQLGTTDYKRPIMPGELQLLRNQMTPEQLKAREEEFLKMPVYAFGT